MSNIADLMKIFSESSAYDYGKFPKVSERKRQFKESEEGIREMSEGIQKLIAEEMQEVRREAEEEKRNTILGMIGNLMRNAGMSAEEAMENMGIPQGEREMFAALI